MRKFLRSALLAAAVASAPAAFAGGQLEELDITNATPDADGLLLAELVGIRWDDRAIPVRYRVNDSTGPGVPNPIGAPVLTLADASTAMQRSFDQWNDVRTSYIDMQIVGQTSSAAPAGFDFVNELTFTTPATFGAIAVSPSVSLIADACLLDGEDINGDGTADVSDAIAVVTEIGGQNVFPAGCYEAGTILDNDVLFNTKSSNGFRFTVGDGALDTNPISVDLETVATHEFGHSHGLSHALTNNRGANDARSAVMFPFINTGDPDSEGEQRTLDTDDRAITSWVYREGSASSGPGALQAGDVRFDRVYGLIRGSVEDADGAAVAGANVYAISRFTDERLSSAFSGRARVLFDPVGGGLFVPDPEDAIANGDYEIAVPLGLYSVGIEPLDGLPVSPGSISLTAQIGSILGQQNFDEAFWNLRSRFGQSPVLGQALPVPVLPRWGANNIDFTTEVTFKSGNLVGRFSSGFTDLGPGSYYVVRVPIETVIEAFGRDFAVQSALFETRVVDSSTVPNFAEAMLTTGRVDADLNIVDIDLRRPLLREAPFLGADNDFAPLYARSPRALARRIELGYRFNRFDSVFLVLRLPTDGLPFPGPSAYAPLVGLGIGNSPGAASYYSEDGATFTRVAAYGFRFQLAVTPTSG
ncbi:MAG: matrixin family metalloprotease [Lysobacter sp.]